MSCATARRRCRSPTLRLSRINLTDDADTIARKIRKAKTDPEPLPSEPQGLAGRPEADNLVGIYAALKGETVEDTLSDFGGSPSSRPSSRRWPMSRWPSSRPSAAR
jgi:tryptophanyl-tRNA synthetase